MPLMLTVCFLAACGGGRQAGATVSAQSPATTLQLPVVPDTLTDAKSRLAYVLLHYWDAMPWADSARCADTAYVEQSMVDFIDLMTYADSAVAAGAYAHFLDVLPAAMSDWLTDMASDYLFTPDSPVYNPETFAAVADAMVAHGGMAAYKLDLLKDRHAAVMKNRVGRKAADFEIATRNGGNKRLYGAAAGARHVILLFYDPDCEVCAALEHRLAQSAAVNAAIERGELAVVAVDPYGTAVEQWREHAAGLPDSWVVGYSPEGKVYEDEVYVVNAAPCVYLLDGDMRVQVKDATDAQIAAWLANLPSAQP